MKNYLPNKFYTYRKKIITELLYIKKQNLIIKLLSKNWFI